MDITERINSFSDREMLIMLVEKFNNIDEKFAEHQEKEVKNDKRLRNNEISLLKNEDKIKNLDEKQETNHQEIRERQDSNQEEIRERLIEIQNRIDTVVEITSYNTKFREIVTSLVSFILASGTIIGTIIGVVSYFKQ